MGELEKAMIAGLSACLSAGLATYGKGPVDASDLRLKARIYLGVLEGWATPEFITRAAARLIREGGSFPSASEFAAAVRDARRDLQVSIGVEVGDAIAIVWVPKAVPVSERLGYARRTLSLDAAPAPAIEARTVENRTCEMEELARKMAMSGARLGRPRHQGGPLFGDGKDATE